MLYKKGDIAGKAGNHFLVNDACFSTNSTRTVTDKSSQFTPQLGMAKTLRAPIDHTYRMMEAMDKYNKPFSEMAKDTASVKFYFLTLLFLQNHLRKAVKRAQSRCKYR